MPDRRRWVDVWHAPDRGAALERVHVQPGEHVVAAIPGDRKWCVLVARPLTYDEIEARIRALYTVARPAPDIALSAITTS